MPRYNDLIPLIDILGYLENTGCTNGMPFFGSPLLARGPLGQAGPVPDPELTALLAQGRRPRSRRDGRVRHEERHPPLELHGEFLRRAASQRRELGVRERKILGNPGTPNSLDEGAYKLPLTPEVQAKFNLPQFGIPSLQMFSIGARSETNPTPGNGHIWFSPIIPRTGEAVFEANRVFRAAAKELDLPIPPFSLPTCYWERAFIFLFGFPITHDVEANKKNRAAFRKLVAIAAEHGWGEYRTAPAHQAAVMDTYSFNNHALLHFHETLKDAVDPNGILSAGRYGIWPKHLRREDAKA